MAITTVSATVDATTTGRVDLVIRKLTEASHSQVRGFFDHGCVRVNGNRCESVGTEVVEGDVVEIRFDPTQRYREKKKHWDDRTFKIIFEDNHLIVVNKSAGILTMPTDVGENNTLVDRVSVYLSHSRKDRSAWVVHRLDRSVSGLLVFGKHKPIADQLLEQFKRYRPKRTYIAIVAGVLSEDAATFRGHIATSINLNQFVVSQPTPETELAITHYRVLKRFPDTTLVELTLDTATRNQIRVQFANAGHPVLGDSRYQSQKAAHPKWSRKQIALHAKTLAFKHPISGELVSFDSALPPTIEKFIARYP